MKNARGEVYSWSILSLIHSYTVNTLWGRPMTYGTNRPIILANRIMTYEPQLTSAQRASKSPFNCLTPTALLDESWVSASLVPYLMSGPNPLCPWLPMVSASCTLIQGQLAGLGTFVWCRRCSWREGGGGAGILARIHHRKAMQMSVRKAAHCWAVSVCLYNVLELDVEGTDASWEMFCCSRCTWAVKRDLLLSLHHCRVLQNTLHWSAMRVGVQPPQAGGT